MEDSNRAECSMNQALQDTPEQILEIGKQRHHPSKFVNLPLERKKVIDILKQKQPIPENSRTQAPENIENNFSGNITNEHINDCSITHQDMYSIESLRIGSVPYNPETDRTQGNFSRSVGTPLYPENNNTSSDFAVTRHLHMPEIQYRRMRSFTGILEEQEHNPSFIPSNSSANESSNYSLSQQDIEMLNVLGNIEDNTYSTRSILHKLPSLQLNDDDN